MQIKQGGGQVLLVLEDGEAMSEVRTMTKRQYEALLDLARLKQEQPMTATCILYGLTDLGMKDARETLEWVAAVEGLATKSAPEEPVNKAGPWVVNAFVYLREEPDRIGRVVEVAGDNVRVSWERPALSTWHKAGSLGHGKGPGPREPDVLKVGDKVRQQGIGALAIVQEIDVTRPCPIRVRYEANHVCDWFRADQLVKEPPPPDPENDALVLYDSVSHRNNDNCRGQVTGVSYDGREKPFWIAWENGVNEWVRREDLVKEGG